MHKKNISDSIKGKKRSVETKEKQKQAALLRWEKPPIMWPSMDWIHKQLEKMSKKELAKTLGVKPTTFYAKLHREKT